MTAEPASTLDALRRALDGCPLALAARLRPQLDRLRQQPHPAAQASLARQIEAGCEAVRQRAKAPLHIGYPPELPVAAHHEPIIAALASGMRRLVLTGETGSGKTTQLPKMLLQAGYGRRGAVAITQPRRLAAQAVAARLRDECKCAEPLIAHSVRHDDRASDVTLLRIMTDGLLLAELSADPLLLRYDAIVIDEAHERSLNIDVLLGLLAGLAERRPELCLVVTSASIEAERFAAFLGKDGQPAPIIAVAGRTHPVTISYRAVGDDDLGYLDAAIATIRELHATSPAGDVLCFLPTERDILEASRRLGDLTRAGAVVLPLFSRLTPQEQQRVFAPARGRKLVLSTNIAETSLTVPGVVYVVDSGLARITRYAPGTRTERLPIEAISQASALQRAGRAGRIQPGECIRLYTQEDHDARPRFTTPEILRANLSGVALHCLHLGIAEPERFRWLDPPSDHAWQKAREQLDELGALDESAPGQPPRLSAVGRQLARLHTDPALGRIMLCGVDFGVAHEACTIAAFIGSQDPRVRPLGSEAKADSAHRAIAQPAGDIATVLHLWDIWQAAASNREREALCRTHYLGWRRMREWSDLRHQLLGDLRDALRLRKRGGSNTSPTGERIPAQGHAAGQWPIERIHKAVLAGMLGNLLHRDAEKQCWRGTAGREVHLHPGSALAKPAKAQGEQPAQKPARRHGPGDWLVACELVQTSRLFARLVCPVEADWVIELAAAACKRTHADPAFDEDRGEVTCIERISFRGLPIVAGRRVGYARINAADAQRIFIEQALAAHRLHTGGQRDSQVFATIAANRQTLSELESLVPRLRDHSQQIDASAVAAWYTAALARLPHAPQHQSKPPEPIASAKALAVRLRSAGSNALRLRHEDLFAPGAWQTALRDFPLHVSLRDGRQIGVHWRYSPGSDDDGASIELRESDLPQLDVDALWVQAPGLLRRALGEWLRLLPRDQRRTLGDLDDAAAKLCATALAETGPLHTRLGRALAALLGEQKQPVLDWRALPAFARWRFVLRGADGSVLLASREADLLRAGVAGDDGLGPLRALHESAPANDWPAGETLADTVSAAGLSGHLAIVRSRAADARVAARVAVLASAAAATAWHADGMLALFEAALGGALDTAVRSEVSLPNMEKTLGLGGGALLRGALLAQAVAAAGGAAALATCRSAAHFAELKHQGLAAIDRQRRASAQLVHDAHRAAEAITRELAKPVKSFGGNDSRAGARSDLQRLGGGGLPSRFDAAHLERLPLYLDGVLTRLRADASRLGQYQARRRQLLDTWNDSLRAQHDERRARALGLGESIRQAAGWLEDCLHEAGCASLGQRCPFNAPSPSRLLGELDKLNKALTASETSDRALRAELLELRPYLERAPAPAGPRLLAACDLLLRDIPDLGMGADPASQRARVQRFIHSAQAFLRAG